MGVEALVAGRCAAAAGGGNAVTDAVCMVVCSGVVSADTSRSEVCDTTLVLNEEAVEVESDGACSLRGRGLVEASACDGYVVGACPKCRICAPDEDGCPLFEHDEVGMTDAEVD